MSDHKNVYNWNAPCLGSWVPRPLAFLHRSEGSSADSPSCILSFQGYAYPMTLWLTFTDFTSSPMATTSPASSLPRDIGIFHLEKVLILYHVINRNYTHNGILDHDFESFGIKIRGCLDGEGIGLGLSDPSGLIGKHVEIWTCRGR